MHNMQNQHTTEVLLGCQLTWYCNDKLITTSVRWLHMVSFTCALVTGIDS